MMTMWTTFAKTGDPGDPLWPAYADATDKNVVFGDTVSTGTGVEKAKCDALFKLVAP